MYLIFQTLTTAIETVPPQGVLNPNDTVSGVTDATGNTFQTGDTINGWNVPGTANNNVVSILDTGTGAAVTATVNNVARINHTLLGPQTYSEALYTKVGQEWVTAGAGGATLTINSANAATTYGISSGTNSNLTLTYSGAAGQTATFALANAGLIPATGASTASAINVAGGANISTVSLVTTGKNTVSVNGGASLTTIGVLGDGANSINVGTAGWTAAAGVTLDASAALGKNTFDLGTNYAAISTIKGSTGTSETVVAETLTTAASAAGWTNVDTVKFSNGSNGGTLIGSGNTSITKVIMADRTVGDNTTVNGLQGVTTLTFEGTKTDADQTFSAITFVGSFSGASNALAVNFDNGGVALSAGKALTVGGAAIDVSGAENVTFDFANGVGSTGNVTFGTGITDTTLQTLVLKNAGTGAVDIGQLSAGASTITSVDASGVAGNFTVKFDTGANDGLATSATILGSAGANDLKFWNDAANANSTVSITLNGTGAQLVHSNAAALTNQAFNIVGKDGNFVIDDGAAGAITNAASTVTLGNGNNLVALGNGADAITVGNGANTIFAGAGNNLVTAGNGNNLVTSGAGNDTVTVGNGNNTVFTDGGNDIINVGNGTNTVTAGTGADTINIAVSSNVTTLVQFAADSVVSTANTLGATYADGNTITFGNKVDVASGWAAGNDRIDTFTAANYTNLNGAAVANLGNHLNYGLTGDWNASTKTFTINAVSGHDTLVVADSVNATATVAQTDTIILVGTTGLTTANFV